MLLLFRGVTQHHTLTDIQNREQIKPMVEKFFRKCCQDIKRNVEIALKRLRTKRDFEADMSDW